MRNHAFDLEEDFWRPSALLIVFALAAMTVRATWEPCLEALTVLLLAVALAAVASLVHMPDPLLLIYQRLH